MKTEAEGHLKMLLDLNVEEGPGAKECKDCSSRCKNGKKAGSCPRSLDEGRVNLLVVSRETLFRLLTPEPSEDNFVLF